MSCIVFLRKIKRRINGLKCVVLRFLFLLKNESKGGAYI